MKEYVGLLFCVCIAAAIVKAMVSENATKKYIEMICALCVICVISQPIIGYITETDGLSPMFDDKKEISENYDEIYNSYLMEQGLRAAEDHVSERVCESLETKVGAIRILLTTDEESGELISATAVVGIHAVDIPPEKIRETVRESLGVECEIVYELFDE